MIRLERPLCVFDLEATGVDPQQDRIVEISVLRREPDGRDSVFSSLVNPGIPIPAEAVEIHGITDAMVAKEPAFRALAPRILKVFEGADLAGFNAIRYDVPLLSKEFERANEKWPGADRRVLDPHVIFQRKERRDLASAYRFFCGKELAGAHRAEADVRAAAEVLWAQVERYGDLPKDVAGLGAWCAQVDPGRVDAEGKFIWRSGEAVFNFGVKRGMPLREIAVNEPSYLKWMVEKGRFSPDVLRVCREALAGRFPRRK